MSNDLIPVGPRRKGRWIPHYDVPENLGDLYAVLGVDGRATQDEISRAYKSRARFFHPDRPQGNAAMMAAVNLAYGVLSDPERKKRYDQTGDAMYGPGVAQAREMIMIITSKIMESQVDMGSLYEQVLDQLEHAIHEAIQTRTRMQAAVKEVQRRHKSLKLKAGGFDFIGHMVSQILDNAKKANKQATDNEARAKLALQIWKETYEDGYKPPSQDDYERLYRKAGL